MRHYVVIVVDVGGVVLQSLIVVGAGVWCDNVNVMMSTRRRVLDQNNPLQYSYTVKKFVNEDELRKRYEDNELTVSRCSSATTTPLPILKL